ncbi:MAG: cytochrome bc complex cytochrome b subunit [Candidatus Latescibacteria bacterium]|nr:cytochrome bc complex cytochrome b subunit [Candidatus Latescibacterota bacterium]
MDTEKPKQPGSNPVLNWVEERVDLSTVRYFINKKTVPMHRHSIWYYFGGMALFLFCVQVATGILLLLYYRPTTEAAFESVQFLVTKVEFGWLIRNVHSWSANLMIAVLFVHMFSAFMMKAYRKPRELTWVSGVCLFGLSLGFGFSGYLLPWNELAYFATKVGTEIVENVPVVGHWMLLFLRGGEDVTGATLTRFFGFHVAVLPMLTTALLGLHLLLVQTQGMSSPPSVEASKEPKKTMPFVPQFALRDLLGWLVILGVLVSLAAYFPWELGTKADPFAVTPAGIQPEWYFLFAFEFLKLVPSTVLGFEGEFLAIAFMGLAGLVWLLVPFLDRRSARGLPSPLFTWFGILAMAFVFGLTLVGWLHAKP